MVGQFRGNYKGHQKQLLRLVYDSNTTILFYIWTGFQFVECTLIKKCTCLWAIKFSDLYNHSDRSTSIIYIQRCKKRVAT